MAELHGAQRHRLGWSEADLERETPLFVAEVERALHAAVDTELTRASTSDETSAPTAGATEISAEAAHVAVQYAAIVARHMFTQATWTALRAFRVARATETP
jgi:hypothetical protein